MNLLKAAWVSVAVLLSLATVAGADTPQTSTRMVDSNGHKVAFHVTPGHEPVIVLDAGGGLDSTYWDALVPDLAKRTGSEIITYDRVGFGASNEVAGPWNVQSATDDLENGLKALGATRDVILVSHSLAGEIATYLARRHSDWLAGAVLVDANIPQFFTDAMIARQMTLYKPILASVKAAPPTKAGRQLLALAESFVDTSRAFHKAKWPASVPAAVIVSEKTPFDTPADAQRWRDAHAAFAREAENRTLITAGGSSHDVAHDRPDIVIQAIADMAARAH